MENPTLLFENLGKNINPWLVTEKKQEKRKEKKMQYSDSKILVLGDLGCDLIPINQTTDNVLVFVPIQIA